jgi:hypoxanthine phosphoribosyltransferase
MFIADLVRRLALPVEVDFMTVSSYGNDTVSSRQVRIIQDLETAIKDRDVLIVEDIVDTGYTLSQVQKILQTRAPNSLASCTLLNKPSRREVDVTVDWVGFEIPDSFVIGYGIDFAQQGRNLPHIGVVKGV